MTKLSSEKSNFLLILALIVLIFFQLYREDLFPFSNYVTIDLVVQAKFASINFFKLGTTEWAHEYYYPRLFFLPFFVLYKIFNLSLGIIEVLMFLVMIFMLVLSGYFIFYKSGGHSYALILVSLFVVNGDFANVVGIFFLLYLLENPTILRLLILALGYYPFVGFLLPYLFLVKKKNLAYIGGLLIALQSFLSRRQILFTWKGFDPDIRAFNIYFFLAILFVIFIYFVYNVSATYNTSGFNSSFFNAGTFLLDCESLNSLSYFCFNFSKKRWF
jgi:hypothetical protein